MNGMMAKLVPGLITLYAPSLAPPWCLIYLYNLSNLSDHSPLMFTLCATVEPFTTPASPSSCPSKSAFGINWSKVSSTDIDQYCVMVSKHLPSFPQDILNCSIHDCSVHHEFLDSYTHSLISVLDSC